MGHEPAGRRRAGAQGSVLQVLVAPSECKSSNASWCELQGAWALRCCSCGGYRVGTGGSMTWLLLIAILWVHTNALPLHQHAHLVLQIALQWLFRTMQHSIAMKANQARSPTGKMAVLSGSNTGRANSAQHIIVQGQKTSNTWWHGDNRMELYKTAKETQCSW